MLTDTEGIVLKQIKTSYNRRMILLLSRKYGKISAGTSIGEKGRSRSSLALRPFTYGRYELYSGRNGYNINSAEALKSYYRIGEDVDKYMNGAYILEYTEKILPDELPVPGMLDLLAEFFSVLENRQRGIGTLVLAYQTKTFRLCGVMPQLDVCVSCGEKKAPYKFSIEDGGVLCRDCWTNLQKSSHSELIYDIKFGIVDILKYFTFNSLKKLENLALKEEAGKLLQTIIRAYAAYYLDASDLKSEKMV